MPKWAGPLGMAFLAAVNMFYGAFMSTAINGVTNLHLLHQSQIHLWIGSLLCLIATIYRAAQMVIGAIEKIPGAGNIGAAPENIGVAPGNGFLKEWEKLREGLRGAVSAHREQRQSRDATFGVPERNDRPD